MQYSLSITTDAKDAFAIAGGKEPVYDTVHASNGGSSIVENVNADVILNWTGEDGSTKQVTKSKAIANNGDTVSDAFVPGDFGWESWQGGEYWFDIHVAQQGSMAAAVDTPDRDPRETWDAWLPNPNKEVVGSGEESGDKTYENINGLSVFPGQKLEYSVGLDLVIPENVREKITSFAVQDSFDSNFIPNKTSVEFWDSRDAGNPKPVSKKAYELTWDAASNSFTATFTDDWVKDNILGNTAQGWLTMRFTGQVKDTTPAGSTVKNQAFQIVNGVKIATKVPVVEIPSFTPDKEVLDIDLIDIDGKTLVKGDKVRYQVTMDATPGPDKLAYNVHKLGVVDDYDEEYLAVDPATGIRLTNKATGVDVTDQFNIQILDGVVYAFAKTIDTTLPNGETVSGDPQPANLKAYDEAPINPETDPIINQDLMGTVYNVDIMATVTKEVDGYVIENIARQNLENSHRQTKIVSNPLKAINPDKDVVIAPGGDSIDGAEIPLNSVFNYELNSSELPADRAYGSSQWSFADTFDRVRDSYTGIWAVYANTDVYDGEERVFKKGDLVADSAGSMKDAHGDLFTVAFDEASYTLTASATQAYFDLINTRLDLAQSFSVYSKMVRIAPAEKVENVATETYNNVDRQTDVVWTKTPGNPAIDIEKFTLDEGLTKGDRDTADQAYSIPKKDLKDGTRIGLHVTNTGDVNLKNVVVTDRTHPGLAGRVKDIVCVDGISEIAPNVIGDFAVGESIDCQGTLTGVKDGQLHGDTATATGESIYTGKKVTDEDPWFSTTPGALAQTGGTGIGIGALVAGIGALVAGTVLTVRRRRGLTSTATGESADN
ncbi:LPXTG cell wall anchor domain-containing protein [Microbacterium sp. NPDC055665]